LRFSTPAPQTVACLWNLLDSQSTSCFSYIREHGDHGRGIVLGINVSSMARQMCNPFPPVRESGIPTLRPVPRYEPMLWVRVLTVLVLLLPVSGHRLQAQTAPLPELHSADPFMADLFHRSRSTGMVVVVVRDRDTWMQSYGQTYPGSHQKPNADSLIRLCSLTKIMTTDLLVKLVADGHVSLSDPLQKFAPHNVTVPVRTVRGESGRPITLRDLATHTAGFPREIAYPAGDSGHFTFPDYSFRWQWLPGYRLRFLPGTAAHYSNIGFDLLADALAAAAGKPYPQLFADRIAKPVGLRDTTLSPTPGQCARLLIGARNEGRCTDTTAAAGSGGMYSTANDMTRWLKYLLGLPGVPVHQDPAATATYIPASELRWTQGIGRAGVPNGIGLGWVHLNSPDDPAMIIEKTGGGAGYTTYIALNPARHIGIFVAATQDLHAGPEVFRESNDLLIYLAGLTPVPGNPLDLAGEDNHSDAEISDATVRKAHKHGPHVTRQMARTSVVAVAQ
jgi:serine-type D-Ala-D-Ala carboxypeptidase/endopeptidase